MSIVDLILTFLGWVKHPYYDWGLSLLTGSTSGTLFETVIGQIIHFIFTGVLGVFYTYIVLLIPSRNYLLRGWLYGVIIFFAIHVTVNLFGFQPLRPIPTSQLLSDFVTASIFGLVLAETMNRFTLKKIR
ncbi:MAG: hypothetical protein KGZ79_04795 [Dethiobacter sp.]|nr:hypothetical protein [Dethiobacter sp.]